MIRDLLDRGGKVNLFTRPRRFGKTLNLSMIRRFFEREITFEGKDILNGYIFDNLKISSCGESYMAHQGKYPIISLSLKSAKQPTYEMAYKCLVDEIAKEYKRHIYVLRGERLTEHEKKRFQTIMNHEGEGTDYVKALEFLSSCLMEYHEKKVIILIDEYDVPLENAYFNGFYEQMACFIRLLFESALKTNESLKIAVVTGCLRISGESIFTGLNNLKVVSVLDDSYAEYFGFTQDEVDSFFESYSITQRKEEVKSWYNGYVFGSIEVYNPWSVY